MALTNIIPSKRIFLLFLFFLLCLSTKANNDIYTIKGDTLIVKEGITKLWENDIDEADYFTVVSLPNELEYIGESVFENCKSIREIVLPEGLKHIGSRAYLSRK